MSQGRVPLSEPKVRKILDTTERMLDAFERVGWGALLIGAEGRGIRCCNGPRFRARGEDGCPPIDDETGADVSRPQASGDGGQPWNTISESASVWNSRAFALCVVATERYVCNLCDRKKTMP